MPSCTERDVETFLGNLPEYDSVFYKSLSKNDHQWADIAASHQSGVLIPRQYVPFFGLSPLPTSNATVQLEIDWLLEGERYRRSDMTHTAGRNQSRLKYYCEGNRASRPEAHLTCVYNPYFEEISDGSLLVVGRKRLDPPPQFDAFILDAGHPGLFEEVTRGLDIPESPLWGVQKIQALPGDYLDYDIAPGLLALLEEYAEQLYGVADALPSTKQTSDTIWELLEHQPSYLKNAIKCPGLAQSNSPFRTAIKNAPGNLTRWSLQKAEFHLVRCMEGLHYPPQFISQLKQSYGNSYPGDWEELETAVGRALEDIVSLGKSITQSRRSRAGNSFEWHINNLLEDLDVPFERQAGSRRVDFLLKQEASSDLVLSAKTSTRERWKQVPKGSYFITLDRQITEGKLHEIRNRDLTVVVPEADTTDISQYSESNGVITFREFFRPFRN